MLIIYAINTGQTVCHELYIEEADPVPAGMHVKGYFGLKSAIKPFNLSTSSVSLVMVIFSQSGVSYHMI